MSKRCKICNGRGRWCEIEQDGEEEVRQWYTCNSCKGTGVSQDPDDGDDFDIGGSSYADED